MKVHNDVASAGRDSAAQQCASVSAHAPLGMSRHALRILALVPPDKRGEKASRHSFLSEELERFAARGVEVHVVSPYVKRRVVLDGVNVHPIPRLLNVRHTVRAGAFLSAALKRRWLKRDSHIIQLANARTQVAIAQVIRRQSIDVVYSPFLWPNGLAGVPAAEETGVPIVASLRGADVLTLPEIGYGRTLIGRNRVRTTAVLKAVDHVVGVSAALAKRAIELGADPKRTSIVLKGVDVDRFHPRDQATARQRIRLPDRPTVLFVGNLIELKSPSHLISCMQHVRKAAPSAYAVFCGDGPLLAELKAQARESGLADHVHFAGHIGRDVIPDFFNACDVFVLPSLMEGSGNVLVEAAACAKPVVGSAVGGIPDYLDDGITGFLFRTGDVRDLAAKVTTLLTDPERAVRIGTAGRNRVEQLHKYDFMIDQLLALFDKVVATHSLAK